MKTFIQLFENPKTDKLPIEERAGSLSPEYYEKLKHMAWDGKLTLDDIKTLRSYVEFKELLQLIKVTK